MDSDKDGFVDRGELHAWILRSFKSLSQEESEERFEDNDENDDGIITWAEYKSSEFDLDDDEDFSSIAGDPDKVEEMTMMEEDKILFEAADKDSNGELSKDEFLSFTHPEEDAGMIKPVLRLTLNAKDQNKDGKISFQEYIGERGKDQANFTKFFTKNIHFSTILGKDQSKEWLVAEKERFDSDLDKNKDGVLDEEEIIAWVIPDNNDIATDEVNHLFAGADFDVDGVLSVKEILDNHELFVGSEATDYGEHLHDPHRFDDEL